MLGWTDDIYKTDNPQASKQDKEKTCKSLTIFQPVNKVCFPFNQNVRFDFSSTSSSEWNSIFKNFQKEHNLARYTQIFKKIFPRQGAKKVLFTACHSGKLKLTFSSQNIISTSPKNILMSRLISQFFCNLNSSKNFTCPLGKMIT